MLYLVLQHAKQLQRTPLIWAGRNAHKTFLTAVALLDLPVQWLYPKKGSSYLSCNLTAEELHTSLEAATEKPAAVYLTSPDYLGNTACRRMSRAYFSCSYCGLSSGSAYFGLRRKNHSKRAVLFFLLWHYRMLCS